MRSAHSHERVRLPVHSLLHAAVTSNVFIISKSCNVPTRQEDNEQSAERIYHAVLHRTGIATYIHTTPQVVKRVSFK